MRQHIILRYFNPTLGIALSNPKTVYLILPEPVRLQPEVRRGKLVYRARGSSKRISYEQIKRGLTKQSVTVTQDYLDWF